MRALLVEVADVHAENVLELAAPEDQEPVETLPAHAADPAFRVGIGVGRLDRRSDDVDALISPTNSTCLRGPSCATSAISVTAGST